MSMVLLNKYYLLILFTGIRAHEFIGQANKVSSSSDKTVISRGIKQSEQSQILSQFNSGFYNVLIATSIAEEGLDIAEVDLIIFFEAVSSTTRQIQREGRTGRKRSGRVVVLALNKSEEEKILKCFSDGDRLLKSLKTMSQSMVVCRNTDFLNPLGLPMPFLSCEEMNVGEFHSSQVEGPNTKRARDDFVTSSNTTKVSDVLIIYI
jgi:ERCC4-related helicase